MPKVLKVSLIAVLALIVFLILLVGGYAIYVFASFYRIDDNMALEWNETSQEIMRADGEYTALSYNVGFGAYSPDFTFFMDGGKESVARSAQAVKDNINGSIELAKKYNPDFMLVQELDIKATRSHKVNTYDMYDRAFNVHEKTLAINYDSPFLMYPLTQPHGKSLAGISTMSKFSIEESVRRSLPITKSVARVLDLDRCYTYTKIPVDNGKSLYVYNVHLSAYGGSPEVRAGQVNMLIDDMKEKMAGGNYVVCGGDFNHDLTDDSQNLGNMVDNGNAEWAQPFPFEMMPQDISFARNYIDKNIPTARNNDIPYQKGVTQVFILDGFFVSSNILVSKVENVDNGFMYSDHNPVVLTFKLA